VLKVFLTFGFKIGDRMCYLPWPEVWSAAGPVSTETVEPVWRVQSNLSPFWFMYPHVLLSKLHVTEDSDTKTKMVKHKHVRLNSMQQ